MSHTARTDASMTESTLSGSQRSVDINESHRLSAFMNGGSASGGKFHGVWLSIQPRTRLPSEERLQMIMSMC